MAPLSLDELSSNPEYRILKRVPEEIASTSNNDSRVFTATIIDLETMGMNAKTNEIIEIGVLSFSFSTGDGLIGVIETYNELNDPGKPIPLEITRITGITNEDVAGKKINWDRVGALIKQSHLIICHNSRFDRNFLELQTPEEIKTLVERKPFACTVQDINWRARGYESAKLEYLNFKLGYFYNGHRALNDCWATLNLLRQEVGAFDELKSNVRAKETLLCAENAAFDKKDLLKGRNYRWSDGLTSLPKCWWIVVSNDALDVEKEWLDEEIFGRKGIADKLPTLEITAFQRYSYRAEKAK